MFFNGLPEMPIENVSVKNVVISEAKSGIVISQAKQVKLDNIEIRTQGDVLQIKNVSDLKVNGKKYENNSSKAKSIGL